MKKEVLNVLVISDSHGNINFLHSVVNKAKEIADIKQIWHLGDEYEDMNYIDFDGIVKRVPGTRHPDYNSGKLLKFLSFAFANNDITIIHSPYDIPSSLIGEKRLFFHGHLHRSNIEKSGNGIIISPGHIKCHNDRGYDATFLIVQFSKKIKISQYIHTGDFCAEAIIENTKEKYKLSNVSGKPIGWESTKNR